MDTNGFPAKRRCLPVQNVNLPISTGQEKRTCKICKIEKTNDDFYHVGGKSKHLYMNVCKICHNLRTCKWKAEHKEKGKEWAARYRKNNPEKAKAINRRCAANKKLLMTEAERLKLKLYFKEYYSKNKDKKSQQHREHYLNNKEKYKISPEKRKIYRQNYNKTPENKIHKMISSGIYHSLKNKGISKGSRSFKLLGYSLQQLVFHLESLFLPGMTWDNYGKSGWEVDHKIPQSFFDFSSTDDFGFMVCWSLENLQPMWGVDNWRKGDKIVDYQVVEDLTLTAMKKYPSN